MTPLQQRWLKLYLDPENKDTFLNATASVEQAGYKCTSKSSATTIGSRNLKTFGKYIEKWFDEEGLGEKNLKRKLFEGLDAEETKFFAHQGEVIETHDVTAWAIRFKFLELAMKHKGMIVERREFKGEPIKIDLGDDLKDMLKKVYGKDEV